MDKITHTHFILNGELYTNDKFSHETINFEPTIYEVIRIMDGIPLFLEDHVQRLHTSIQLLNFSFVPSKKAIERHIHNLIEANKCFNENVKIALNYFDEKPHFLLYFIPSYYPTVNDYKNGIHTILYHGERNQPNAKIIAKSFREDINKKREENNAYEAILVNKNEEITEGSRSNIFIVKDKKIYTATKEQILVGITRTRVIDLCKSLNLSVMEQTIPLALLVECDGLFLTGTSPKVLPIASVGNKSFSSTKQSIIVQIINGYNSLIGDYIKKSR